MIKALMRTIKRILWMIYRQHCRQAKEQAELEAEILRRKREENEVADMRTEKAKEEMWRIKFDNAYKHCAAYGTSQYGANRRYYRRHRTSGNN